MIVIQSELQLIEHIDDIAFANLVNYRQTKIAMQLRVNQNYLKSYAL